MHIKSLPYKHKLMFTGILRIRKSGWADIFPMLLVPLFTQLKYYCVVFCFSGIVFGFYTMAQAGYMMLTMIHSHAVLGFACKEVFHHMLSCSLWQRFWDIVITNCNAFVFFWIKLYTFFELLSSSALHWNGNILGLLHWVFFCKLDAFSLTQLTFYSTKEMKNSITI